MAKRRAVENDRGKRPRGRREERGRAPKRKHEEANDRKPKPYKPGKMSKQHRALLASPRFREKPDARASPDAYVAHVEAKLLQPSRRHYGGMGVARESQFVRLDDPAFLATFATWYREHVAGMTGWHKGQRNTKGDMLWKQHLNASAKERRRANELAAEQVAATAPAASKGRLASQLARSEKADLEKARRAAIEAYRAIRANKGRPSMTL